MTKGFIKCPQCNGQKNPDCEACKGKGRIKRPKDYGM